MTDGKAVCKQTGREGQIKQLTDADINKEDEINEQFAKRDFNL